MTDAINPDPRGRNRPSGRGDMTSLTPPSDGASAAQPTIHWFRMSGDVIAPAEA